MKVHLILLLVVSNSTLCQWYESLHNKKMLRFDIEKVQVLVNKAAEKSASNTFSFKKKFLVTDDKRIKPPTDFEQVTNIDDLEKAEILNALFIVFFHTDDDYFHTLKTIKDNDGKFYSLPFYGPKTRYIWTDKYATQAISKTFAFNEKISHQTLEVHETICECLNATKHVPGDYIEIGVYKGGSALTALHYMKFSDISRRSYFFDTFNGMTYEEAHQSPDLIWDNTHTLWGVKETMRYVDNLLKTTGKPYKLIESNICRDNLPKEIEQIAVCNLDVDLYEPTRIALEKVAPLIVKGGIIICEDPTSMPTLGGALVAMEEFLKTKEGGKFMKLLVGAQYLLIKITD